MTYQELLILLPCHSLEDFPTYHEGEDAQGLLSAWSAMWQPELLANSGQAPTWKRIEDVPTEVKDRLIVVPSMCASRLPTGFAQRVKEEGGCLVKKTTSRAEVVSAALEPIGGPKVDAELAADFLALGYAYLQIQLLTRQMRYSSNLDEVYFKGQAIGAAVAAVEGNVSLAKEKLSACFNVLAEERDHYYPVDAFILDLNLTAATTLGSILRNELSRDSATNLLLSAAMLEEMQAKEPQTLEALKQAVAAGKAGIIGGEASEDRLPLMSQDSIVANLQQGLTRYEELLGKRPEVFGRWRFGLTPVLPGILTKTGFRGALHASFEEGTIPSGTQFKVRWEGLDGAALDSITRTPLDASKPQTFLAYASKMGESMDSDHVATLCLAHWPGQESEWLGDLRRIAGYCKAMGKFVTVDEYFAQTDLPGHLDRYEADRYKSPYLKQGVIRKNDDPISTSVRYWQRQAKMRAAEAMETLATLVMGKSQVGRPSQAVQVESLLAEKFDAAADESLQSRLDLAAANWARCLAGGKGDSNAGLLVLNPNSFVRRMGIETTQLTAPPAIDKPIYAADSSGGPMQLVVDVPPMGYVFIPSESRGKKDSKPLLLAEDNTLRNEFFEAVINPTTGTLAALHEYKARGNRMSQQLALRMPGVKQKPGDTYRDPDETARYSVMAADGVEVTAATTALGEITTRGRLLDLEGKKLAGFVQKYRVWRGSRVLTVDIELDPVEEPKADPWNSYFCCRFAWGDETSDLFRTANETRQPASGQRFEAPHYIEMLNPKNSTTILTGGLPFHRRHEHRMLDSLLITRGETERKFRVGIGIDLTHPMLDALSLLTPPIVVPSPAPTSASSWLFHLDSRNVVATHWEPLVEDGKITGFRVRLLETAGRPAGLTLSAFKPVGLVERVDFLGKRLDQCQVQGGKIKLDMAAHEFVEVVGRWP
jgi:alpha-mannosidase